ncbi:hypothetical protein SRHO_G00146460 [Serrasalmus rhombeus]
MSGTRPVLCITVMLLLGAAWSRRRCDYSMILSTYTQLIFPELQNLNLTGPFETAAKNDRCPSSKVTRIVRSIYGMTEQFACLGEGQQEDSKVSVVSKMGQLIKIYCRKTSMGNGRNATSCKTVQRKKERRRRRIKMIEMLINCWQKLQSAYIQG